MLIKLCIEIYMRSVYSWMTDVVFNKNKCVTHVAFFAELSLLDIDMGLQAMRPKRMRLNL